MKFDPDGVRQWYRTGWGFGANIVRGLILDSHGSIVVHGNVILSLDFGDGIFTRGHWIIKYSEHGEIIWNVSIPSDSFFGVKSMNMDEEDYMYLLHRPDGKSAEIKKIDPDGQFLWKRTVGASDFLNPTSIACQDNYCYITGWFEGILNTAISSDQALGIKDIFIFSVDSNNGNIQQVITAGSDATTPTGYFDSGYDLLINNDELYITGSYKGKANFGDHELEAKGIASDIFFARLSHPKITSVTDIPDTDLNLYPNPASETINLSFQTYDAIDEITIISTDGTEIGKYNDLAEGTKLNVSHLSDGIYFLKIITQQRKMMSRKISILK